MAFDLAESLQRVGFPQALALELQKQINAGAGNISKLMALGVPPVQAKIITAGITSLNADPAKMVAAGMNYVQAKEVAGAINGSISWFAITLTAGAGGGQWVGFSDGGANRPQPAFGSISGQPTTISNLLAVYDDTASGNYIAVFSGDHLAAFRNLPMQVGSTTYTPFNASVVGGNTWIRYTGSGDWVDAQTYTITFG